MPNVLYVISDLHLGGIGSTENAPGFQMCSARGRERLARLIRHIGKQASADRSVELIINGDFIDFLAEMPFETFSASEEVAAAKLKRVLSDQSTIEVMSALKQFVETGARLTVNLGNHDLELCLPKVRKILLGQLGQGRVELVADNEALTRGPVLIEHGNRYDGWNRVDHDGLRQLRSLLSRREPPSGFKPPAGSKLVIEIMNDMKKDYPFIDLLKPETDAALPLLGVLAPEKTLKMSVVRDYFMNQARASFAGRSEDDGRPKDEGYIAADMTPPAALESADIESAARAVVRTEASIALTREMISASASASAPSGLIGASDTAAGVWAVIKALRASGSPEQGEKLAQLHRALKHFAQNSPKAMNTDWEYDDYRKPAEAAARRGFKVVVYGHTHLLKRVPLDKGAVYVNTGTWADLISLPKEILSEDQSVAETALTALVSDLVQNRLEKRRGLVPSYARIEYGEETAAAELKLFRGDSRQDVVGQPTSVAQVHETYK